MRIPEMLSLAMALHSDEEGNTAFAALSREAQDIIVDATLGRVQYYDAENPMPEDIRGEILDWVNMGEPSEEGA